MPGRAQSPVVSGKDPRPRVRKLSAASGKERRTLDEIHLPRREPSEATAGHANAEGGPLSLRLPRQTPLQTHQRHLTVEGEFHQGFSAQKSSYSWKIILTFVKVVIRGAGFVYEI